MENYPKKNIYIQIYIIYIIESLCCTPETSVTLKINSISIFKKFFN